MSAQLRIEMPLSSGDLEQAVRVRNALVSTLPKLDESWLLAFNAGEFAAANAYATAMTMVRDALEIDP
jgi:hypothetical protein